MITKERLEVAKTLKKGFTLIEILIVVAIIAILASVVLVGLGPTQQAGRDARRVSDIHEVQNGLELYYNKCGIYPATANCQTPTALPGANWLALQTALANSNIGVTSLPQDPSGGAKTYVYGTNTGAVAPVTANSTYVVYATMENASGTVFSSYAAPALPAGNVMTWAGVTPANCNAPLFCVTL